MLRFISVRFETKQMIFGMYIQQQSLVAALKYLLEFFSRNKRSYLHNILVKNSYKWQLWLIFFSKTETFLYTVFTI